MKKNKLHQINNTVKKWIPITCFIVFVGVSSFGCKMETTNEKPIKEKSQSQVNVSKEFTKPVLDSTLNPTVVLKDYIKIFADTLDVQMYVITMNPGDSIPFHQHLDFTAYVLQGGKFIQYKKGKDPREIEIEAGSGFLNGPVIDAAKNSGETTMKMLITEIHRPREN